MFIYKKLNILDYSKLLGYGEAENRFMTNKQKSILLIVIDCLRADFVYEEGKAYIPTIKKLKESGSQIKHFHVAQALWLAEKCIASKHREKA